MIFRFQPHSQSYHSVNINNVGCFSKIKSKCSHVGISSVLIASSLPSEFLAQDTVCPKVALKLYTFNLTCLYVSTLWVVWSGYTISSIVGGSTHVCCTAVPETSCICRGWPHVSRSTSCCETLDQHLYHLHQLTSLRAHYHDSWHESKQCSRCVALT